MTQLFDNGMYYVKKKFERKKSNSLYFIGFIYMYSLFAPDRLKRILSLVIDGSSTTNEIWLIYFIFGLHFLFNSRNSVQVKNFRFLLAIYTLFVAYVVGFFNVTSFTSSIYSGLIFFTPFLLFVLSFFWDYSINYKLIKLFVVSSLIYSIFAIVLSTNYAFFMRIVGNTYDNFRYFSQYRAPMMIGSSITVSYYFNLMLPFSLYLYFHSNNRKWRRIGLISSISNIFATLILLSRTAALSSIVILVYLVINFRNETIKRSKKVLALVIILILSSIYVFIEFDLSKFALGINPTGNSAVERSIAARLGIEIFKDYPIFGSGMGEFYKRIYENRFIEYNDIFGLIDPHNAYILLLSEVGLFGFGIIVFVFVLIIQQIRHIRYNSIRRMGYVTIFTFLVNSLGGSHIVNEISFASIFWITIGIYYNFSINNDYYKKNKRY